MRIINDNSYRKVKGQQFLSVLLDTLTAKMTYTFVKKYFWMILKYNEFSSNNH